MGKKLQFDDLFSMSDDQILSLKICDLPLSIDKSPYAHCLDELHEELRNKGLLFKPKLWISDEWFCPDGVTAMAMPFFLLHPKLIELEKKMMGQAEGENLLWFMQLLRHECGHAVDNAYFGRDFENRKLIFGDHNVPYPSSYIPKRYSKKYVKYLEENYAQAHPEEDWAETFATWLDGNSDWNEVYKTWPALKKLKYMDSSMKNLVNKKPNVICYQQVDHFTTMEYTLQSFYNYRKKNSHKSYTNRTSHKHLGKIVNTNGQCLRKTLKKDQHEIVRIVSARTNEPSYRIKEVIKDLDLLAQKKGLKIEKKSFDKDDVAKVVVAHTKRFLKEKKHRIIM